MLNPRKRPKNPPQLEIKSNAVILGIFSYSEDSMVNYINNVHFYCLPIAVADPKNKLTTERSLSKGLYLISF